MFDVTHSIDLQRYPIHKPASRQFADLITHVREELADDGCAVLKGFVRTDAIEAFVADAERASPFAHTSFNRTNAYFSQDDKRLPQNHPIRRFYDRSNAFIPADNFGDDSPLRAVYEYASFMPFIRKALDESEERFFRYDDPLADVIVNRVDAGGGFPWHFDTNNYTVTLAIQNGEHGGDFEYCPAIRTPTDENFAAVEAVLDGDRSAVKTLVLEPGDLQIFKGRYALHRVTAVEGQRTRYVGIFSYVETENMCGGIERTKQLYGRVLPHHYERAGVRNDQLLD